MDKLTLIDHTITKGFPWLVFPKVLEDDFQVYVRQRILKRALPVGISAGMFVLAFCGLDWLLLDPATALHTSVVRITLVLPVIIMATLWLHLKPPSYYLWIYSATLLISSASIVYIIWLSHNQGIILPYEGLMIAMMYGFFIMALPFYLALGINILIVLAYALTEPFFYSAPNTYLNNVLFLTIVLLSAAIGAYVTEHNQRANFLRKRMLDIHHENTLLSIQHKNKYLAIASHDIRQPLQGIALIGKTLERQDPNNHKIQKLNQGIHTLNSMFSQMLDISKINLNLISTKLDTFHLQSFITQNSLGFDTRLQSKKITLTIDIHDCIIKSDFTILSRVLYNLIENALNHSQADEIKISNTLDAQYTQLTISDNGKGISPHIQDAIFNEFVKDDQSHNGLGLGLAIVAQFCEKLNHPLSFNSQTGNTQFTIRLPLAPTTKPNMSIAAHEEEQKKTILLIDDDTELLSSLSNQLCKWGYKVTCANGLQHGMSLIHHDWHLVICDWDLGDGCGEKVIQYCVEHKVPSLLISSSKQAALLELTQLTNSLFLPKPISLPRLRSQLLGII